jgi:hydroxyethylthiazole kinase-like sugar kinase family protein
LLGSILYAGQNASPDPDDDWHAVEYLANRTAAILSAATGEVVMVIADPACSSCSLSRPHRVNVGALTVSAAQRLTAAVQAAHDCTNPRPG